MNDRTAMTVTVVASSVGTAAVVLTVTTLLIGSVNARIEDLQGTVNARVEDLQGTVNTRIGAVLGGIDGIEERLAGIEERLAGVEDGLRDLVGTVRETRSRLGRGLGRVG